MGLDAAVEEGKEVAQEGPTGTETRGEGEVLAAIKPRACLLLRGVRRLGQPRAGPVARLNPSYAIGHCA